MEQKGYSCTTLPIKSTGDIDLVNPIYEIGVQGVFTKELDAALLQGQADVAVHSLKDIPTVLAKGLEIAAILERGAVEDILFIKPGFIPTKEKQATVATSSIRRKAQWLERFPHHQVVNVRGNVDTRLKKFNETDWDGMIMAKAGVERLGIDLTNTLSLPWMLPSPAQGAIAVVCRENDDEAKGMLKTLHHEPTHHCVTLERSFLSHLHGGCSVPISAIAILENNAIRLKASVHSLDGSRSFTIERSYPAGNWKTAGKLAAAKIKASEKGNSIVEEIQKSKLV